MQAVDSKCVGKKPDRLGNYNGAGKTERRLDGWYQGVRFGGRFGV